MYVCIVFIDLCILTFGLHKIDSNRNNAPSPLGLTSQEMHLTLKQWRNSFGSKI